MARLLLELPRDSMDWPGISPGQFKGDVTSDSSAYEEDDRDLFGLLPLDEGCQWGPVKNYTQKGS